MDLSDYAVANLRSAAPLSHARAIETVKASLDVRQCPRHQVEPAKYKGVLYPAEALGILEFSKTCGWPGGSSADEAISAYLLDWCEKHQRLAPAEYSRRVVAACRELNCLNNAFQRLNVLALAQQELDRITIATKVGRVTRVAKQSTLSTATKDRLRRFLTAHQHFVADIGLVYSRLEAWNKSCTLEASLLGWICSLIFKAAIEREDQLLQLTGNELLLANQRRDGGLD